MMNIQKKEKGHANRGTVWRQAGIGKRRLTETHWQVQRARIIFVAAEQVKRNFNGAGGDAFIRRSRGERRAGRSALSNVKEGRQTRAEDAPRPIY
ncbi:MAG: hypothetical protein FJ209_09260 [Betaproteobacteria bacterium]|nr:hypothetical protein [Betaproteobacteria bacterium]